jgi:hypothetical protein
MEICLREIFFDELYTLYCNDFDRLLGLGSVVKIVKVIKILTMKMSSLATVKYD